jgi:hypothetical protein
MGIIGSHLDLTSGMAGHSSQTSAKQRAFDKWWIRNEPAIITLSSRRLIDSDGLSDTMSATATLASPTVSVLT